MPYPKGRPRPARSGRGKGTPNKTTAQLRAVVAQALDGVGGSDYLAGVARERPELFLALVRRILPRDVDSLSLEEAARVAEAARKLGNPEAAAEDRPGGANAGLPSLGSPVSLGSPAGILARLTLSSSPTDFGGEAA